MRVPVLVLAVTFCVLLCVVSVNAVRPKRVLGERLGRTEVLMEGEAHEIIPIASKHNGQTPAVFEAATPDEVNWAYCNFNNLTGVCITQEQCLQNPNQTSLKPTTLCAKEGQFCCIYQKEAEPGCGTAALARAATWANMQLDYCQAPNGGNQSWLPECTPNCHRASNANWDNYRSDCSGLVSYSYGLEAPGRTTREFAPYQTDVTFALPSAVNLMPGDPINSSPREHIMLFHSWNNEEKTSANFYEEPDCGIVNPWARLIKTNVKIESNGYITLASNGMTFVPIRFNTNKDVC